MFLATRGNEGGGPVKLNPKAFNISGLQLPEKGKGNGAVLPCAFLFI